ncbi:MAG: hypothetical protein M3540_04465 [Actinomycetota bacterium]|nr:hypothetical protein [Actinomycetota bacterium]
MTNGERSRGRRRARGRGLPPFLFDPNRVVQELAQRPKLQAALGDPHQEGEPSEHFPDYRKSPLQIYRVLANLHFEHLEALVDSLEFCLVHGFEQPKLIRTGGRAEFASALSELQVAEHFLLRGFAVSGFDATKGSDPVPDLRVEGKGLRALVEVYRPVDWEGLDELERDVTDAMKNLDVPFEYLWRWDVTQLEQFDRSAGRPRLLHLHPESLADAVERDNRRAALVRPLVEELEQRLLAGDTPPLQTETTHPEMNVRLSLTIEEAAPRDVPAREGVLGGAALSGYAPETMFERLVKDKVRKKASKRQARSDNDALEILVVDVSGSKIERRASPRGLLPPTLPRDAKGSQGDLLRRDRLLRATRRGQAAPHPLRRLRRWGRYQSRAG